VAPAEAAIDHARAVNVDCVVRVLGSSRGQFAPASGPVVTSESRMSRILIQFHNGEVSNCLYRVES
jgi:hypothetical protein